MKILKRIINLFRPFRFKYWVGECYGKTRIVRARLNPSIFGYLTYLKHGPFDSYQEALDCMKNDYKTLLRDDV